MTKPPLIRRLTLQNFLSYGPEGVSVDLLPLNVLIGPNASGKSNLLEALALCRGASGDLLAVIREGGGIGEYLWKGPQSGKSAELDVVVTLPSLGADSGVAHHLVLDALSSRLAVSHEFIGLWKDQLSAPEMLFVSDRGNALISAHVGAGSREDIRVNDLKPGQSVLSQRRDPVRYPELTSLAESFGRIVLFQDWYFGKQTHMRLPQPTDLPSDFLLADRSNLSLILHDLGQTSAKREELIDYLRRFYENARYISTKIQGGTIQLYIEEEGGRLIPAPRLSDGTLKYLCLLAILCHPNPPPVIGIEEPELGLHPDIMPTLAELLRRASERTQLFVTTHSDALVSALSDTPESILVCEATPDGTTMKRLEAAPLREWLEKYSLGEIWRMGEIGGNRW